MDSIKAIPHKDRLRALYAIYLQNFRHLAHKSLDIRQYICEISVQSDENSDSVSYVQSLCGIALGKTAELPKKIRKNYLRAI